MAQPQFLYKLKSSTAVWTTCELTGLGLKRYIHLGSHLGLPFASLTMLKMLVHFVVLQLDFVVSKPGFVKYWIKFVQLTLVLSIHSSGIVPKA